MEHQAVAEAGVIGKPDPMIGEMVKAFVALKTGSRSEELRSNCSAFARKRLGAAVAPKEIEFRRAFLKPAAEKLCGGC